MPQSPESLIFREPAPRGHVASQQPGLRILLLLSALAAVSRPTYAHSDDYLDSLPAPHGGQIRMAGPLHLELVIAERAVEVFVTDHAGTPRPTAGGKASLRVAREEPGITLKATGGYRFAGSLPHPVPVNAQLTLFVMLPGEQPHAARFTAAGTAASSNANPNADHAPPTVGGSSAGDSAHLSHQHSQTEDSAHGAHEHAQHEDAPASSHAHH
jgi:hypothetical protein